MPAKYLTLNNGRKILLNTPEEDAAVKVGIELDADTYQLDPVEFKKLRPGRPLGSGTKTQITLRLDTEVVNTFRASGEGWQTRINELLRDAVKHGIAKA